MPRKPRVPSHPKGPYTYEQGGLGRFSSIKIPTVDGDAVDVAVEQLNNVTITSVADGEILVYDTGTSDWINQTLLEAGIAYTQVAIDGFSVTTPRTILRLIGSTNIDVTIADDPGGDETEITFTLTGTIDADTLDGYEGADFAVRTENETITGLWSFKDNIILDGTTTGNKAIYFDAADLTFTRAMGFKFSHGSLANDLHRSQIEITTGDFIWQYYNAGWNTAFEIQTTDGVTDFKQTPTVNGTEVLVAGGSVYYQEFRRDGFSAMTPRTTLHLSGANGIAISASDDAGNDETDITITAPDHALDDLTNVSDPGGAVDWNMLRWNSTQWERTSLANLVNQMQTAEDVAVTDEAATWTAIQTHSVQDVFNAGIDFGGDCSIADSATNLLINSQNAVVINLDSDNTGTAATFQIQKDGTTTSETDIFVVEETGEAWALLELTAGGTHSSPEFRISEDSASDWRVQTISGKMTLEALGSTTPTGDGIYIDDGGTNNAKIAGIKNITSSATAPTGDYPYGTLHLIY